MTGEQTTTEPRGSHQPGDGRHDMRLAISRNIGPVLITDSRAPEQTRWTVEQGSERCLSIMLRGDHAETEPVIARVVACVNACAGINPAAVPDMLEALREISLGEGPFNRDPMKHAENTVEAMKELALAAIAKAEEVTS